MPHLASTLPHTMPSLEQQQQVMNDAIEKARRAAELQKKIQEQLASKPNLVSIRTRLVFSHSQVYYLL
jgi:hypothetical protein